MTLLGSPNGHLALVRHRVSFGHNALLGLKPFMVKEKGGLRPQGRCLYLAMEPLNGKQKGVRDSVARGPYCLIYCREGRKS